MPTRNRCLMLVLTSAQLNPVAEQRDLYIGTPLGVRIRVGRHQNVTSSGWNVLPLITDRARGPNARTDQGLVSSLPCSVVRERSDGPVRMTNLR
jgi:hypothetical protein